MIQVSYARRTGFLTIDGHAGPGCTNVCEAVSTLYYTAIHSIEAFTDDMGKTASHEEDYGHSAIYIDVGNISPRGELLLNALVLGCKMLSEAYPQCVRVLEDD